jgi:hypothetical protein
VTRTTLPTRKQRYIDVVSDFGANGDAVAATVTTTSGSNSLTVSRGYAAVTTAQIGKVIGGAGIPLPVNDVQTLTFGGTVTGGTFTLTWNGQTTSALNWNATAQQVAAALIALSNIGTTAGIQNVRVTGGPGPAAFVVTFVGSLANAPQAVMTRTSSLTGTSPTLTVTHTTTGVVPTTVTNVSGTTVTMSANATASASLVPVVIGSDNWLQLQRAISSVKTAGTLALAGAGVEIAQEIFIPGGNYLLLQEIVHQRSFVTFRGVSNGERSFIYDDGNWDMGGSTLCSISNINLIHVWRQNDPTLGDIGRFTGNSFQNLQFRGSGRTSTGGYGYRSTSDYAGTAPTDGTKITNCAFGNLNWGIRSELDDDMTAMFNWVGENNNGIYYGDPTHSNTPTALYCKIEGNGIYDNVGIGCQLEWAAGVMIIGNGFARNNPPIQVTSSSDRCVVADNIVRDPVAASDGIQINGTNITVEGNNVATTQSSPTGSGIVFGTTTGGPYCSVVDNAVDGFRFGVYLFAPSGVYGGVTINDNRIRNCGQNGIVANSAADSQIQDNFLFGNGTEANNTYDQILITGTAGQPTSNLNVQGNVVEKGSATNKARYGIRINDANCSDILVDNNDLRGGGVTGGLSDLGTRTSFRAGSTPIPTAPSGSILENLPGGRAEATASGIAITSGTMRFCGLVLVSAAAGRQISSATVYAGATAGATLTHSWMGLVRVSDRALVAVSADQTTAAWALNTSRTFTGLAYNPTADTLCWVCLVVVGTTMPTFWGSPAPTGGVSTITALAPVLEGNSTTGLTTPQALNTVETAPTATALGVPYVYLA